MNNNPLIINYFTDILCVWAWIAERRLEELNIHFGSKIKISHRYIDLFGDTDSRIQDQWAEKGLHKGFGAHVMQAAAPYETAPVNADVWSKVCPTTSATAHMIIKAVELTYGYQSAVKFAKVLRESFFINAIDISNLQSLFTLLEKQKFDVNQIDPVLNNGKALAALMNDYQKANDYGIKGSPSFVLNDGRQNLFGNIGYKVLKANIEELLAKSTNEASWC
ncbi:MAG: DsbA family protein [Gammaproteobacteria bacterium]|nr:DsbA family protein [Gammaproteobacteria bacterium]